MSDMDTFSLYVQEFYNTQCEARRKELQTTLNKVQEKPECWKISMSLVQGNYPGVVQFYGAKSLYTLLSKRFDEVVVSSEKTFEVREFFVQKLSNSAQSMPHSLLNVLSSGFAVFLLKCLPDIWPDPFTELINLWFTQDPQQELLLRVLAEIASEYERLAISWKQKRILKTSLLKVCPTIVQISHAVLADTQSSPSVKNAAVECIECWLKLPGAKISDFMEAFTSLFDNISSDVVALSRILCTLRNNEELPNLPQIIKQITKFIATSICPVILSEVSNMLCGTASSEDITPLICSVTEFVHGFTRQIVAITAGSNDSDFVNVYLTICHFFAQLSTLDALYPIRESISDLPEPFWTGLREDLLQTDEDKPYAGNKKILCAESVKYFLEILSSAIGKIAYFLEIKTMFDKSEIEQFDNYRNTRADVSSNAMLMAPVETVKIFITSLTESLEKQDIFRSESVLFYIKEASDFIKENHLDVLAPVLCRCSSVKNWKNVRADDFLRFANTLLDVFQKMEHLILTSTRVHEFLPQIIDLQLGLLEISELGEKALETVITFMKNRDASIHTVLVPIITSCYAYFENERNPEQVRLQAIKCVGKGLSFKPWQFILSSLDQILLPRLVSLKDVLDGNSSLSPSQQKSRVLFELSVMEKLVATLDTNQGIEDIENSSTPVQMIINQCVPLFDLLLSDPNSTRDVVEKVCDVLRSGVLSLHTSLAPLIGMYMNYLSLIIFKHPVPASELAKTVFLAFRSNVEHAPTLMHHISRWYCTRSDEVLKDHSNKSQCADELDEQLLDLSYHVVKKCWSALLSAASFSPESAINVNKFCQAICWISIKVVEKSKDVSLIREAFRVLSLFLKNCTESDNAVFRQALEYVAENIISASFMSIQSDLVSSFTPSIADILYHLAKAYPSQTRNAISKLPNGDSRQTKMMFSGVISMKNFRLQVNEMHQQAISS